jgi:hypothetical protein
MSFYFDNPEFMKYCQKNRTKEGKKIYNKSDSLFERDSKVVAYINSLSS